MTIDTKELRRLAQAATPGPWYIGSGTYDGRNIYSVAAITDDEGFTYNPVIATAEDDDNVCWEANARLIVAAPEMLLALQTIARKTLHRGTAMLHEEEMIRVTQAIARATGEQT